MVIVFHVILSWYRTRILKGSPEGRFPMQHGTIIWTRSADDLAKDSKILSDPEVMSIPCIKLIELPTTELNLSCQDIIVTSARCEVFIKNSQSMINMLARARLHTFGKKTAEIFKPYCRELIRYNAKSAEQMVETIIANGSPNPLLYLGPKIPAYPIINKLVSAGFTATKVSLYEATTPEIPDTLASIELNGVVCFASPRTAKNFMKMFEHHNKAKLWAVSIGETTDKVVSTYFPKNFVSKEATTEALYSAAKDLLLKWRKEFSIEQC